MQWKQGFAVVAMVYMGASVGGCLFVPLPGVDGESCSVQTDDAGISVVICPDGSSAPLVGFGSNRDDAGPVTDSDETASLDGGPAFDGGEGEFECASREEIDAGLFDPCGRGPDVDIGA